MRVMIYYINPAGKTEKVLCFGKDKKTLQEDIDLTLKRLGWNKTYCWSEGVEE